MFHLHILGATEKLWLSEYPWDKYTNKLMGEWFKSYRRDVKISLLFVNHPVHPM